MLMRDTEKDENVMVFETSDGGKNNTHTHQSEIMTKLMDLNSNILVFLYEVKVKSFVKGQWGAGDDGE
jgi:hypothetical protein